jgi:hypothetical protein
MPYFTFGTRTRPLPDHKMATGQPLENNDPEMFENTAYQELFRLYEGKVVHGTRTLDEAYYQSLTDKELSDRNCDQVVTRRVQRHELNPGKTWTILRVDQLLLWLIDERAFLTVHLKSNSIKADFPIYRNNYHQFNTSQRETPWRDKA